MNFLQANEPFAVSALVIALGYFLRRLEILKESDGETLARLALNVTLPALILVTVPEVSLNGRNALMPLATLFTSATTVLIGLRVFRNQKPGDKGLSLTASSGYNVGLFAMPIVAGVYGTAGIVRFALLDLGNVVTLFMVAYYIAYRYSPIHEGKRSGVRQVLRMFLKSIPFLCYIIAILMNLAGWTFTGAAKTFLGIFAGMNRGVALLTLGVLLRFRFSRETWKAILPPLLLRYSYGIVVGTLVLFFLPASLDNRLAIAGVVVMPMGLTLIPYAVQFGYPRERAAAIINMGIPVSFVLFWILWALGRHMAA